MRVLCCALGLALLAAPSVSHGSAAPLGGWVESPEGWVTVWRLAPAPPAGADPHFEPFAAPGPAITLAPYGSPGKGKPAPAYLAEAWVWSPRRQPAGWRIGLTGKLEVEVNGTRVLSTRSDQALLPDVTRVDAPIEAGWNRVRLRLEQWVPFPLAWSLRVRTPDYLPVPDLVWATSLEEPMPEAPPICAAAGVRLAARVDGQGWHALVSVEGRGLKALRSPGGAAWTLRIARPGATPSTDSTSSLPELDLNLVGPHRIPLAALGEAGTHELTLERGGKPCASARLTVRPALAERARALAERWPGLRLGTLAEGTRLSLERTREILSRDLASPGADATSLAYLADLLEQAAALIAGGTDPYTRLEGVLPRAYRSSLDGRPQPYALWVPTGYAQHPERRWPLIVAAHGLGYDEDDMLQIALGHPTGPGQGRPRPLTPERDPRALVVAVHGFGDTGHRPPGELDVLEAIAALERDYRIDPARVTLTGFSLGGTVAIVVPLHHPGRFAGAAPLCGYPNLEGHRSIYGAHKTPWEATLIRQRAIVHMAENGLHLPMRMIHGAKDNPRRSELILRRYQKLGHSATLDVPELAHNVWEYGYGDGRLLGWLAAHELPSPAQRVRFRTAHLRYSQNAWVSVDRLLDPTGYGEVDARRQGGRLEVKTTEVTALSLLLPLAPAAPDGAYEVVVDGQPLGRHSQASVVRLARREGRWSVVEDGSPTRSKRPGLSGPLDDVWFGPTTLVYGSGHPLELDANRLAAEHHRRYTPWDDVDLEVVDAFTFLTRPELAHRNLVLIGSPASNPVTAQVVSQLDWLRFEAGGLRVGGVLHPGPEVGISFIYPSPFDPARYVVVHAGVGPEGTLSSRHLPELAPDYLVYDSRIRRRVWDKLLADREARGGGFFDAEWRLVP
jgi:predicted esterase